MVNLNKKKILIFQDIHRVIRDHFLCFECLHVPRLCNSFAHEIAALDMCWDVGMSEVCEYPVPNFVQNLVARDLVELLLIKGLSGEVPKKSLEQGYHPLTRTSFAAEKFFHCHWKL
jgi:hypothetical protein